MKKTLRNIVAGSLIAGSLLLGSCQDKEPVKKITYAGLDQITGVEDSYDKALKIVQNPNSVFTGDVVKEESKQEEIKVYMKKNEEDNYDIYADVNGEERRLTTDPAIDIYPVLSPDKRKVTFNSNRDDQTAIYVLNLDGKDLKKIGNVPLLDNTPTWSEDSKKITYKVWNPEVLTSEKGELVIGRKGFNSLYEINLETGEKISDNSELNQILKEESESHTNNQ